MLLVDTPSLDFRAFFGVPESAARAPDGRPVNAVRGLLDMLATLIRTRKPNRLICAFDYDWRPAWRVELIDTYKKHRVAPAGGEEVPDTLSPQVPIIVEALAAFGIPAVGAHGYEADDVLGTLATTEPGPVEVISGDRDLFQLIDDTKPIRLLYCGTRRRQSRRVRRRVRPGQVRRAATSTPTSPRCAGIRATAFPGSRASATRPRRAWSTGTAAWPASWRRSTIRPPVSRPGSRPR